jgi:hypothetical protein
MICGCKDADQAGDKTIDESVFAREFRVTKCTVC